MLPERIYKQDLDLLKPAQASHPSRRRCESVESAGKVNRFNAIQRQIPKVVKSAGALSVVGAMLSG
jgi:hypothetical protein